MLLTTRACGGGVVAAELHAADTEGTPLLQWSATTTVGALVGLAQRVLAVHSAVVGQAIAAAQLARNTER